jgi:hypothetical protein
MSAGIPLMRDAERSTSSIWAFPRFISGRQATPFSIHEPRAIVGSWINLHADLIIETLERNRQSFLAEKKWRSIWIPGPIATHSNVHDEEE